MNNVHSRNHKIMTGLLKLTMNPRKRSSKRRSVPHRLRLPNSPEMDVDDHDADADDGMVTDNLIAITKQEESGKYSCADYLNTPAPQHSIYQLLDKPEQLATVGGRAAVGLNSRIDEYCREQIVEWSFRVVDYFRIDREVVAVSLCFLDRFLASCRCDRTSFKLAATTTLHLAVKLLYPCKLGDLGILSDLSRGEFDMRDVSEMESLILRSLAWNLHPPTAISCASLLLDNFFMSRTVPMSSTDLDDVYDVSLFFCELAVCDYYFVPLRSSSIAVASILNALEGMFGPDNSMAIEVIKMSQDLKLCAHEDLPATRNRLWELYERSEECALHNDRALDEEHSLWNGSIFVKKMTTLSPVSVSKPCHSASDFVCTTHTHSSTRGLRNGSW
jgi:Cyclin, N-terminal domain/Cyclin, C-terminal domain